MSSTFQPRRGGAQRKRRQICAAYELRDIRLSADRLASGVTTVGTVRQLPPVNIQRGVPASITRFLKHCHS